MADSSYDLVIIGGGTAGSSAAPRAAQLGLRVLLLEKQAGACLPVGVAPLFARDEHVLRRYLEVPLNALSFRGFLLWLAGRVPRALLSRLRADSRN